MNIITISHFDELNVIFNDSLYLSEQKSQGIYHNMWCIALEGNIIKSITLNQLNCFVDKLIKNRQQQLKNTNFFKSVVFYMWFDEQALQLRFNIIAGDVTSLPFGCNIKLHTTPEVILNNFITVVREVAIHGDDVEFFNNGNLDDEDETEEYILNVFAKKLTV